MGDPSVAMKSGPIDVLTQLAYRKWLIAKITGIAVLAVWSSPWCCPSATRPPPSSCHRNNRQSSASMLMNQLTSSGAGSLAAMAGGGLGLKNPNDIYVGLLNSRPVADAIIQRFGLGRSTMPET